MKRLRNLFEKKPDASAEVARERLKLMISQDRMLRNQPDFLPRLQRDLIEVIRRYTESDSSDIEVSYRCLPQQAQLELNVSWSRNT